MPRRRAREEMGAVRFNGCEDFDVGMGRVAADAGLSWAHHRGYSIFFRLLWRTGYAVAGPTIVHDSWGSWRGPRPSKVGDLTWSILVLRNFLLSDVIMGQKFLYTQIYPSFIVLFEIMNLNIIHSLVYRYLIFNYNDYKIHT